MDPRPNNQVDPRPNNQVNPRPDNQVNRLCGVPLQRWAWVLLLGLLIVSIAMNIALSVPGGILRHRQILTTTTLPVTDAQPITNSFLGAAPIVLSTPFTLNPEDEVELVYNGDGGKICIRMKLKGAWRSNIQCVEGANPKTNTPLTMLDWLGGPSVYFINSKNRLSGIDYIPKTDSWRLSCIANFKIAVHEQSQLASMTWRNGTSAWLYYQVSNGQIWELGMDDYRDQIWHDGPTGGPLGEATIGSGIGVTRWINDTAEVEEIFFMEEDGPIVGRMYAHQTWLPGTQNINGTSDNLKSGASITAATVKTPTGNIVMLAYVSKNGFLQVQTRGTVNISDYTAYTSPVQVVEGNGQLRTGLVSVDNSGVPTVYFMNGQKVLEVLRLTRANSTDNWTVANI